MLEQALGYAGLGWRVFRLTGYKTPLKGSHGFKDATSDVNVIGEWWGATGFGRCNIGLATGWHGDGLPNLGVFDADGDGGLTEFRTACGGVIPRTLCAKTSGGWHFYFLIPPGMRLKSHNGKRAKAGDPGVDVKADKAYVVLPPSVNAKTGFVYQWLNWGEPIAALPDRLLAWHVARRGIRKNGPPPLGTGVTHNQNAFPLLGSGVRLHDRPPGSGESPSDFPNNNAANLSVDNARKSRGLAARALGAMRRAELPTFLSALRAVPADGGYDEWFRVGAAIYDFDPSDAGLEILKSRSTPEHHATCEAKWLEYAKPYDGQRITVATIYALAKENGWSGADAAKAHAGASLTAADESPQYTGAAPTDVFGGPLRVNGHHVAAAGALGGAAGGSITLEGLNERFAAVGDMGGRCVVMGWVPSKVDDGVVVPSFQTFKSFSERYAHKYVIVKTVKPDGSVVEEAKQAGSQWLKWIGRKSYEGIDLAPGEPEIMPGGLLNLWRGFSCEPVAGEWNRLRQHIEEVLAGGDRAAADYILKFAAWSVQHPGERAEAALVFRGEKGTGKGTFANALRKIFGQHGLQIFNSKHLVGAFNGHLRSCLLLFSDEAFWAGDKQGESVLKGLLTEPTFMMEDKGINATPWRNRLHVVMSANAEWVVPASHDERRYSVFDVSSRYRDNRSYFAGLHDEITHGGLPAMLHDLLAMDLKDWHPRQIVRTEALRQQKIRSMSPLDEWWEGTLQRGTYPVAPLVMQNKRTDLLGSMALYEHAKSTNPRLRELSLQAMGRYLKKASAEGSHREEGNCWRLAPLKVARDAFEAKFGEWVWDHDLTEWEVK